MKPMLAVVAGETIRFPVYASPKLDGVRCVIKDGIVLSRTLKPIPNMYIQGRLALDQLHGLDGELIVGEPTAKDVYRQTSSGVMSQQGTPKFTFFVFDYYTMQETPFKERFLNLLGWFSSKNFVDVKVLEHRLINNAEELLAYETKCLADGYEGLILRHPDGIYKFGRSTLKEGYMLKLKRFSDGEAKIVGYEELMHNANEAQTDELGRTKRSSHQENLVPMDTLGALLVEDCETGIAFKIGTGYTATQRQYLWKHRGDLINTIVKYKHFEIGVKDAPRFPVWLGFRDVMDMG